MIPVANTGFCGASMWFDSQPTCHKDANVMNSSILILTYVSALSFQLQ